jgi:hypothetical protein
MGFQNFIQRRPTHFAQISLGEYPSLLELHCTTIPKGVLEKIRRLSFKYLWVGHNPSGGTHLVKWSSIVIPKDLGGWGLKDLRPFAQALIAQNLWRLSQGNSLWTRVMTSKYLPNLNIAEWF